MWGAASWVSGFPDSQAVGRSTVPARTGLRCTYRVTVQRYVSSDPRETSKRDGYADVDYGTVYQSRVGLIAGS